MANSKPYRISAITEIHRLMGLPKPHHPLISIVDLKGLKNDTDIEAVVFDLYVISMKRDVRAYITGNKNTTLMKGLWPFCLLVRSCAVKTTVYLWIWMAGCFSFIPTFFGTHRLPARSIDMITLAMRPIRHCSSQTRKK